MHAKLLPLASSLATPDPVGQEAPTRTATHATAGPRWLLATLGLAIVTAALLTSPVASAQASPAGKPAAALPKPGSAPTREAAPGAEPVAVESPWVRASVAKQRSTGAFLKLTARDRVKLVAVESPVADIVEIHEMALVDNVMRMRAVDAIALDPGQSVELRPGGYHVMLIDLRQQVKVGDQVGLTLVFEDDKGQRVTQAVTASVRSLTDSGGKEGDAGHGAMDRGGQHSGAQHQGGHK